jgi:hypothetical protein
LKLNEISSKKLAKNAALTAVSPELIRYTVEHGAPKAAAVFKKSTQGSQASLPDMSAVFEEMRRKRFRPGPHPLARDD